MTGVETKGTSRPSSEVTFRPTPDLTPAVYPIRVTHLHRAPVQHYGEHRSYSWYVDIDDLPQVSWWLRPFARFEAADHLDGAPDHTLRQRVDAFLARHGVHIPGGRVTALLMPRVLGRAFNPLSLFWCQDSAGITRCVIAEVQDVDGRRRAFLLPAAEDGPAAVTDELRGAPFAGDGGYFLVRVPRPDEALDLTVSLHRNNHAALVATWRGSRRRASAAQVLLLQLTNPMAPLMARWSLRLQAMVLRWRGMPVSPRSLTTGRATQSPTHARAGRWPAKSYSWATS
jgi:DUF1365 family protein